MSKMGLHDPFGYLKHKLWPKERSGVKFAVLDSTIKNKKSPWFSLYTTYCSKALDEGYNFALDLTSIKGLHTKLWAPKLKESQFREFWDSNLGVGPVAKHKEYYKGEGGGFPKSGPWWVLWIHVSSWFIRAPKMLQLCINQLIVWFMQVCVNNWPAYHSS
jgi:hypothetical protein